jgi:hypothetical protein
MNTDDLFRQMEADEIADRLDAVGKASPREYAQMHGMVPQRIYYFIRSGKIDLEKCVCGRSVIDVKETDAFFRARADRESGRPPLEPEVPEEEEMARSDLDS